MWLIILSVIVFICIIEWVREIVTFKVTHYEIKSEKLNELDCPKKIVFLSDLHNNSYGKNNQKLVDAIMMQKPDLILIGGDMVVGKPECSVSIAESFAGSLTDICPVYYANGNHEQRMKIYSEKFGTKFQEYKNHLTNKGIIFLENQSVDIKLGETFLKITGLEIPRKGYKKFKKLHVSLNEIEECVGKKASSKYQILLAHNPMFVDTYLEWGADLVLSGHLHGGIVRIPGLGGVISPQFRLFPKYSGEHTEKNGKSVVVSRGLGTHTIKIRFLNPAEVVVLHLSGK